MEEFGMARQSKREYLRSIHKRYRQARRKEKSAMLEEFSRVCCYNRKYAIWLLSRSLSNTVARKAVSCRSATYSKTSITLLAKIWEASGYLCSQRLKAALPQWLPWIKKHFDLTADLEEQLLAISARQMDRRLFSHKRTVKRRLYGTTRPGSLLKAMIPIKTDHWAVTLPGYLEIDLVSHSGRSAAGESIYTLDCVDIATGWVERQAVMGKGQLGIVAALREIEQRLPSHCAALTLITAVSSSIPTCLISASKEPKLPVSSSPARGPTKKMTMRMWSRKTGPTFVNSWAGTVMTASKR
jgi:hypothetical protein